MRCWDCRQQDAIAVHTATVVAAISRVEPALDSTRIIAAVERAAPSRRERQALSAFLETRPDALTAVASDAPRVVCRLVESLLEAGATATAMSRCASCGTPARLVAPTLAGRICGRCDNNRRAEPCSRCGRLRRVRWRDDDRRPVCNPCRAADPATFADCNVCGRHRRVNARTGFGDAICGTCYVQPEVGCDGCGRRAPAASRKGGRTLCVRCYQRPRRRCGRCGRVRRTSKFTADGTPLCPACNWAPVTTCSRCGIEAMCRHVAGGPPVCLRCILTDRIDALLTGPDGTIPAALVGLRDTILSVDNPRTSLSWLHKHPPSIDVLTDLAAGRLPLTHPALDTIPRSPSVDHLRELLIACGALPERDRLLARLEQALHLLTSEITIDADARLLRTFATWQVLPRLRRLSTHGTLTAATTKNVRAQLAETARFLTRLHDQDRRLADATQTDIDLWLARGGSNRYWIRDFLRWAARRGYAPDLEIPLRPTGRQVPPAIDQDARWSLARRLLHDDTTDPADRVVGTLVVLYAQPLTRIAALRLDDIHDHNDELTLSLGRDRLILPEPIAGLVRQLPWRRQVGVSGLVAGADQWLFPGRQAGDHIHPEYLRTRMAALGISTRTARTAALLQLAAQIPAVALADLLGMHPNTAVKWIKRANGDYSRYRRPPSKPDRGPAPAADNAP